MANLFRVRTELTGFPGGPGVSTMYFLDINTALPSIREFWAGAGTLMPGDVRMQVVNTGDVIDETNGELVGSWTTDSVAQQSGTGAGPYAAPAGCVVQWVTPDVKDGVRVKGRTYIVPLSGDAYQEDGSLKSTVPPALTAVADAFHAAQDASFVVWHRPRLARPASGTLRALAAHPGGHSLVFGSFVPDRVAVLRSRRD